MTEDRKRSWVRIILWSGAGAGCLYLLYFPMLAIVFFIAMSFRDDPFDNRAFDAELWHHRHLDQKIKNPRGEMYDDLTRNVLKPGMTREEILALLGEPDTTKLFETSPESVERDYGENILAWNLGMWSGLGFDYDSLFVKFDETGQAIRFYRVQH